MIRKDWKDYIDANGDFALPSFLYQTQNDLMKEILDLGVLMSTDSQKLRAFKEQVKKSFKKRWMDLAQALEFFDLIVPCVCRPNDFCEVCSGSRYILNSALSPDQMREYGLVIGAGQDAELADKLEKGLKKAIEEYKELRWPKILQK